MLKKLAGIFRPLRRGKTIYMLSRAEAVVPDRETAEFIQPYMPDTLIHYFDREAIAQDWEAVNADLESALRTYDPNQKD